MTFVVLRTTTECSKTHTLPSRAGSPGLVVACHGPICTTTITTYIGRINVLSYIDTTNKIPNPQKTWRKKKECTMQTTPQGLSKFIYYGPPSTSHYPLPTALMPRRSLLSAHCPHAPPPSAPPPSALRPLVHLRQAEKFKTKVSFPRVALQLEGFKLEGQK